MLSQIRERHAYPHILMSVRQLQQRHKVDMMESIVQPTGWLRALRFFRERQTPPKFKATRSPPLLLKDENSAVYTHQNPPGRRLHSACWTKIWPRVTFLVKNARISTCCVVGPPAQNISSCLRNPCAIPQLIVRYLHQSPNTLPDLSCSRSNEDYEMLFRQGRDIEAVHREGSWNKMSNFGFP